MLGIYQEYGLGARGKNEVHKAFNQDGQVLKVNSIFPTIQGEGPFAGRPAVFVRLSKCCLRCFFCDTDFEDGEDVNLSDTLSRIEDLRIGKFTIGVRTSLVVITGGEPLLQNICPLVVALHLRGYTVQVETSGAVIPPSHDFERWFNALHNPRNHTIVCSPKTPKVQPILYTLNTYWKYLIRDEEWSEEDGLPIYSTQVEGKITPLARPWKGQLEHVPYQDRARVYVHPCEEPDPERTVKNAKLAAKIAMKYGYRFGLQLHKIIGLD